MDNSLKKREKPPEEGGLTPPAKGKTETFLIGKELKTKDLYHAAAVQASGATTKSTPKTRIKTPDSLRQGASQAAGAAPTLRYGPAGDSAPRLRLRRLVWPKGSLSARPHGSNASVWGVVRCYLTLSNEIHEP